MKIPKNALLILILAIASVTPILSGSGQVEVISHQKLADGLLVETRSGELRLRPIADDIVRVSFTAEDHFSDRESLVVVKQPGRDVKWSVQENEKSVSLVLDEITVEVDRSTGALTFKDSQGSIVLSEGDRSLKQTRIAGEKLYSARQEYNFQSGEALYGLGQFQDGHINWRGKKVLLVQANKISVNPFLISTKGYGILWDNYSRTIFDDTNGDSGAVSAGSFWSEAGDGLDYYFVYGPELDQMISGYRELTGHAPLYPKWAYGYFQSKNRYQSWDEIIDVVTEYRDRKIPLDTIVLDYKYWGDLGWSAFLFDETASFGSPAENIQDIHDLAAHLMISIWPKVGKGSPVGKELEEKGLILDPLFVKTPPNAVLHDVYSEEAREIYWRHAKEGIFDQGIDAFWMDGTEPEFDTTNTQRGTEIKLKLARTCSLGPISKYLNTYSLMDTRSIYQNWRKTGSEKRVYILTRSTFAGQQHYAASTWSGDITATWEVFKNQVPAGLNFCMAGVPYWTTDIGGYWLTPKDLIKGGGGVTTGYRELYVRWFQYGAFCPIFRSHGEHVPREVWRFGEPGEMTYDTLVKFDNLRYRLMPYIYSVAWMVTDQNYTMMRGLAMDFRQDKNVFDAGDQFMFGPAILVNPVTEPMKDGKSVGREVYLPQCAGWYDFWTGKRLDGGKSIRVNVPLSTMPLYVKAGSIIPMGPFIQYATEKTDPLEVRVYPGADGSFNLYEDENDNYNYEKGVYSTIEFIWDDSEKALTIGPRQGSFPGMKEKRAINIVIVRDGHGVGVEPVETPDKAVSYDGRPVKLEF